MALRTAFTELFSLEHPIALAPMGGAAGGALAAAVCQGGGLGLVGGGRCDASWLDRELAIVSATTRKPWGVGFQSWAVDVALIERALAYGPRAVMLSFGDPKPLAEPVRRAGSLLIVQVTDLREAREAIDIGADVIVAQGTEAGGHSGETGRSTLSFVPVVVDLAAPTPVLAAGGIADGRGVAAVLALGAAGALVGTRFQTATEALVDPSVPKAIIDGSGEDTERGTLLDVARGAGWPSRYPARTLRHPFTEQWRSRTSAVMADIGDAAVRQACQQAYQEALERGELPPEPVWASESIDLITDLKPAAEIVADLASEAETVLTRILATAG
ncbi:MAG TPA: nitronate monooxygenase [Streptosporangiaceae bacterium]|nr:nitronate monooxygenase [Streptosporangiaceae bacterium]